MSSRFQVFVIAFILAAMGFFLVWYKAVFLEIPLTPHQKKDFFTISAEVSFKGKKSPAEISMALPNPQEGIRIVSQQSEAGDFGYTVSQTKEGERALWSKRDVEGKQKIFYRITVTPESSYISKPVVPENAAKETKADETIKREDLFVLWGDAERAAAWNLLAMVRDHSSGPLTFTAQLIEQFKQKEQNDSINLLLKMKGEDELSLIVKLLMYEKIEVRKVRGIYLEDRQKGRKLDTMLEVYDEGKWELFDLKKGHIYQPENLFVWHRGNEPLFWTKGIEKPKLRFSVTQTQIPVTATLQQSTESEKSKFLNFSLYTLPSSQQNAFKQILLVPMGVLIVVILRILVGIRTMGTFMPVLFALTFIQTSLLYGLIMFFVIVFSGLFFRFYLSRLRLLLVARISAVIIMVIIIMSTMSVISYKLNFVQVLSVTFFPMIILSWTIERMSILWEEEGGREVFIQGMGSLAVAIPSYFMMMNEYVAYLFFNFPELLLVVLSLIILIGRYTGYRVTELFRFKPLGR
ncbi:MAG TPA: inactive transglutaminase family protein [Sulfurovum sp.]